MKATICFLLLLVIFNLPSHLAKAQGNSSLEVFFIKDSADKDKIKIKIKSGEPLNSSQVSALKNLHNYELWEIVNSDDIQIHAESRTELIKTDKIDDEDIAKQEITLEFNKPLNNKNEYFLILRNYKVGASDKLSYRFKAEEKILLTSAPNAYEQNNKIRVKAEFPITANSNIKVEKKKLQVLPNGEAQIIWSSLPIKKPERADPNNIDIPLGNNLVAGSKNTLRVSGISDSNAQPLSTEGKVTLPGLPEKPGDEKINIRFSSFAGVKQKPVFELSAKYVPIQILRIGNTSWRFDPTLTADIGLRSAKTANSLTFNFPFRYDFLFNDSKVSKTYNDFKKLPWYELSDIRLSIGPKFETDRQFNRINTLGEIKFDFDFPRLQPSMQKINNFLSASLTDEQRELFEGVDHGFSINPYLLFDFGGHANNEIVVNTAKKVSVFVPSHPIVRSYVGAIMTFEGKLLAHAVTLTIDGYVVNLGTVEKIGFTTNDGVGFRRIRGFHPHSKTTFKFNIDPSKHYALTVDYENGRSSPNFEYLNKVTTGFNLLF